jgi:thioredoxin reductase (NADPH)
MHDVIIIGAGPAGLSAAFWCDELGLDALVLEAEDKIGGQLHRIYNPVTNYLGLQSSSGKELLERFSAGVDGAEFDLWTGTDIDGVDLKAKRVSLRSGERLPALSMIIATGIRRQKLGVPGEQEFAGKGVMESGTRDGHLYAGEDVCVIGGGDAAAENALLLAKSCSTVTLIHRGRELRARREFREQLKSNHAITVFTESSVTRIMGRDEVEAVEVQRRGGLKPFQIAVKAVLIRIGVIPNTELFRDQLQLDNKGYVLTDHQHETSIPLVFAIGDVSNALAPTISGAVGAGATAAKVIAARLESGSGR